jgi:hypothetical protein
MFITPQTDIGCPTGNGRPEYEKEQIDMLLKVLFALVIIGALALGGFYYKDYLDQNAKAADLETQLKNTNNSALVVSKQAQSIETEIADIVKRSSDAQKAINAEKNTLTDRINSNTIVRSILVLGQTMT